MRHYLFNGLISTIWTYMGTPIMSTSKITLQTIIWTPTKTIIWTPTKLLSGNYYLDTHNKLLITMEILECFYPDTHKKPIHILDMGVRIEIHILDMGVRIEIRIEILDMDVRIEIG